MSAEGRSRRALKPWLGLVTVLALALWVFGRTVQFEFVTWDDPVFLTENPLVVDAERATVQEQLLTPKLGYPIPLTVATYRIEHALFGTESAAPYHATNVLLHLGAIALLFALARRLGSSPLAATLAAAVFGLHPAVAESVAWVTGRKDLLATLATLGAIGFALGGVKAPPRSRLARLELAASALACVAAVLSKPTGAAAALVAAFLVARERKGPSGIALAARVYALPVLVTLATIPFAVTNHEAIHGHREVGSLDLLREAWFGLGYHLGIVGMVRPNAGKYLPAWPPAFDPWVDLLPVLVIALVIVVVRRFALTKRPAAMTGLVLAVVAYLPSANLIPLTRFAADAYVHASLAGVGLFLGAVTDELGQRVPRIGRVAARVALALAFLLSLRAVDSCERFQDSYALWSSNYAAFPDDYRLCRNAANGAYQKLGPAVALDQYRACARRHGATGFERNEALVLLELGRLDEAEPLLYKVLARDPNDVAVRGRLEWIAKVRRSGSGIAPPRSSHRGTEDVDLHDGR